MRTKHISLWKGEVVIIACGGACLGAAEDQNSLLRDAALHVRARMCPSTITHTLAGCFSRVGSVVCSGFLGTQDLLYLIAEENRDLRQRVQAALACFLGGEVGDIKHFYNPSFSLTGCCYFGSSFPHFSRCCDALLCHVFPGPFLALNHY